MHLTHVVLINLLVRKRVVLYQFVANYVLFDYREDTLFTYSSRGMGCFAGNSFKNQFSLYLASQIEFFRFHGVIYTGKTGLAIPQARAEA